MLKEVQVRVVGPLGLLVTMVDRALPVVDEGLTVVLFFCVVAVCKQVSLSMKKITQ